MDASVEHRLLILMLAAYVSGSVPFGLLIGRAKGVDVRTVGSGNIGATNVGRLFGRRYFFLVFFLDLIKGLIPTAAASYVVHDQPKTSGLYGLWLAVALSAILGHVFSLFLKFKGGKGVATGCGVLLGLFPYYTVPGVLTLLIFAIVYRTTGYVSVGSIVATATFPISYLVLGLANHWDPFGVQWPLLVFGAIVAALVILKHKSNIKRLINGTEHRNRPAGPRPAKPAPATEVGQ